MIEIKDVSHNQRSTAMFLRAVFFNYLHWNVFKYK